MKRLLHTALLAVLILALGMSVLYGVRAVLPDYTQEIHAYSAIEGQLLPVFEQQKELILYPWKETLHIEPLPDDAEMEELFFILCDAFGMPVSYFDFDKAQICYSEDGMTGGVRNVLAYTAVYDEIPAEAETELIAVTESAVCSAAFTDGVFCWFCMETETEKVHEKDIKNGYESLCALAKAPFDTETPFLDFANRYGEVCERIGTKEGIDALQELLASGMPACYLYDGRAYFRYTGDVGNLTVICDPVSETVVGFSLELS